MSPWRQRWRRNGRMHGADTELDKLTSSIEAEAEFLASHSHTARAVVDFVKKIDREIKLATNNNLDLKIVFAVGIIAFTVFEVGATAATPVWVTLAIFTVNHFIEMHERQLHNNANAVARTGAGHIGSKAVEPPAEADRAQVRRQWNSRFVTSSPAASGCICRRCAANETARRSRCRLAASAAGHQARAAELRLRQPRHRIRPELRRRAARDARPPVADEPRRSAACSSIRDKSAAPSRRAVRADAGDIAARLAAHAAGACRRCRC